VAAELLHVDGWTGRQTDMTKFQNSANVAKPADALNRALTENPSKISGRYNKGAFFRKPKQIYK